MTRPVTSGRSFILRPLRALAFEDARTALVVAIAAAIGAALALQIFGLEYILGTSPYWSYPTGDPAIILTGWNYFIHDSWHFPIGNVFMTNPPTGVNLVFFDAIPLVAIVGKLFVPLFGTSWHPYGIWHLAIYVLQAVFGVLLGRRLGLRGLLAGLSVAILCLTTTSFLLRFYQESLNGQFLILWAFLNYARTEPATRTRSLAIGWAACLCCALLVTPYLFAMTLPIAAVAHLRLAALDGRRAAISASTVLLSLVVTWFVVGYELHQPTDVEASAFGWSSLNLLSLVLPFYSRLVPNVPPGTVQEGTGFQWDAHAFLGVAVLVLLPVILVTCARSYASTLRRHKLLCFTLALLALYAPGARWFFGRHLLFQYAISNDVRGLLSMFRATGRFFWPVVYSLVTGCVVFVTRRFGARGTVAVAVLAAVQLVDSSASWTVAHNALARPWARYVDWPKWTTLLARYKSVNLNPPIHCWTVPRPDRAMRVEREIEFLAASRGMRTNYACTGRKIRECTLTPTEDSQLQSSLDPDTLYVFLRPSYDEAIIASRFGRDHCSDFSDGWLCSATAPIDPTSAPKHAQGKRK